MSTAQGALSFVIAFVAAFIGLAFSIPAAIVYYLAFAGLTKKFKDEWKIKVSLWTIGVVGFFLTVNIVISGFIETFDRDSILLASSYILALTISTLVFKVYIKRKFPYLVFKKNNK